MLSSIQQHGSQRIGRTHDQTSWLKSQLQTPWKWRWLAIRTYFSGESNFPSSSMWDPRNLARSKIFKNKLKIEGFQSCLKRLWICKPISGVTQSFLEPGGEVVNVYSRAQCVPQTFCMQLWWRLPTLDRKSSMRVRISKKTRLLQHSNMFICGLYKLIALTV